MGERETLQELVNDFERRQRKLRPLPRMCLARDDHDGFAENVLYQRLVPHAASIVEAKMNAKCGGS